MITITCPNCSTPVNVEESWAGQDVQCPSCSGMFIVPGGEQPPALTPDPVSHLFSSANKGTAALLPLILSGAALLIAIVTALLYFMNIGGYRLNQISTANSPEELIRMNQKFMCDDANVTTKWGYYRHRNASEILKTLKIHEVKSNDRYAVVFYSFSVRSKTFNLVAWVRETRAGDWIDSSESEAEDHVNKNWLSSIKSDIKDFRNRSSSENLEDL